MNPYTGYSAHPEDLRWGLKASGILDTVLCSKPSLRYHSFLPEFFPGVDVGVLNHGNGDEVFCFLDAKHGCLIKGFDHTSPMSPHAREEFQTWEGMFDETPPELLAYLDDAEFRKTETTFCIWRPKGDKQWWQGDVKECADGEGSASLLGHIFVDADAYYTWACEYYEDQAISKSVVADVYDSCQVNEAAVLAMNPNADMAVVKDELTVMGVNLT